MDKLKSKIRYNKNLLLSLVIIGIIGITSGAILVTILNINDKNLITEHLNLFLNNIEQNKLNLLLMFKNNALTNLFYIILIWVLGISIIGLPVILIIFFTKTFILGFTISSIFYAFQLKGFLFNLIYVFPGQIFNLIAISLLTLYSISFSIKLIYAVFKKKTIDFKLLINKYLLVLGICGATVLITCLYDSFIMPNIIKAIVL